jgi:hypothetical protein
MGLSAFIVLVTRYGGESFLAHLTGSPARSWGEVIQKGFGESAGLKQSGGALGILLAWPLWQLLGEIPSAGIVLILTLLCILLVAAAFYISFVMNPDAVNLFTYLWGVCGFGLIAYLQSFLIRKAFSKLDPEVMKRKTLRAEGSVFTDEEHRDGDFMIQESSYSDPNWNRREDIVGPDKPQKKNRRRR